MKNQKMGLKYNFAILSVVVALFAAYFVIPGFFPETGGITTNAAIQCTDVDPTCEIIPKDPGTGTIPPDPVDEPTEGFVKGYHDGASGTVLPSGTTSNECNAFGWATYTGDTSIDLNVRVLSEGIQVASGVAGGNRSGLTDICQNGTCGFNIYLDGKISPNTDHTILVQAQNPTNGVWVNLGTSPKQLNCSIPAVPPPPAPTVGCIDVIKETFNTNGQPITPVAQFTFRLNNNEQVKVNDGTGRVRFNNVTPGINTVREDVPSGWAQTSVTPSSGSVNVQASSSCAVVIFKNRQTTPTIPIPPTALSVSCSGNPNPALIGQNVSWVSSASGGNGSYSYSWTGTDGLSGNTRSVTKSYSTTGTKGATVTVTSGSETRSRTCSVSVIDNVQPPTLSGNCSVSPSSINTGGSAVWSANPQGGNGSYSYSWTGTDGLSGNTRSVNKTYTTAGSKVGSVTITSGTQSITRTCNLSVQTTQDPQLTGSCGVSPSSMETGESANWFSSASGGNGSYSYSWTGTDGLSGTSSSVNKTYTTAGSKVGTVTITSGSQSISRTCSLAVIEPTPLLTGSCSVSPSSINTGDIATWSANPSGGTGAYSYSWTGTDGLSGANQSVTRQYLTSGTKTGTVTITSGSQSISRTCSLAVETPPQTLDGSCFATPGIGNINQNINWTANATGGTGAYSYSWSGSVSGSSRTVSQSYGSAGTYNSSITITSGSETITRNCSVIIQDQNVPLSGSCTASPTVVGTNQTVIWSANPQGGNGSYSYSWTGTDGLSGANQSVSTSYGISGNKYGTVVISSGGQSITRNCQAFVEFVDSSNLNVSCSGNLSSNYNIYNGQNVNWNSYVSGGTGSYNYYWSGTDGLSGNSQSTSRTYTTLGVKQATITVVSGTQTRSATCQINLGTVSGGPNVSVSSLPFAGQNPLSSFVYLNQIPYTGLLDSGKGGFFTVLTLLWSALISYGIVRYIQKKNVYASVSTGSAITLGSNNLISKNKGVTILEKIFALLSTISIFSPLQKEEEEIAILDEGEEVVEEDVEETPIDHISESVFEEISKKDKVLFSEKAKRIILASLGDKTLEERIEEVAKTVSLKKPREYGWISINKEILEEIG